MPSNPARAVWDRPCSARYFTTRTATSLAKRVRAGENRGPFGQENFIIQNGNRRYGPELGSWPLVRCARGAGVARPMERAEAARKRGERDGFDQRIFVEYVAQVS
jgi:hypothetical protein